MGMHPLSRRKVISGALFAVGSGVGAPMGFAPAARAQSSAVVDSLGLVAAYFDAAARVVAGLESGAAQVRPMRLKPKERAFAGQEIQDLQAELVQLRARQRLVLGDIDGYIAEVRADGFDAERHGRYWSSIRQDLAEANEMVGAVRRRLVAARWLHATVAAKDLMALDEVLTARSGLIQRLRTLEPPHTEPELDALARMKASYDRLRAELARLMERLDALRRQAA